MNTLIRADFDFKSEKDKIKKCTGYVVCYDVVQTEYGCDFKVDRIVIKKLIATSPDFEKIEQLAIQNCKVLYDDNEVEEVINVGSLADYHD